MNVLFLDQTGKLAGAELSLLEVLRGNQLQGTVALFEDGPFRDALERANIPVEVIAKQKIAFNKDSGWLAGMKNLFPVWQLVRQVAQMSRHHDLIYASTQKAMVVGAIASVISRKPLIFHLRDILSPEHFSRTNRQIIVSLSNLIAKQVIANSQATQIAFIRSGGNSALTRIIHHGGQPLAEPIPAAQITALRQQFGLEGKFVVGHFSRLAPWKGQHVLIEALTHCPPHIEVILVGGALFGEDAYAAQLQQQVQALNLQDRVHFLGVQQDVFPLMSACNLIAQTSVAPEPFSRVIWEAMICERPIIASNGGGAREIIESGRTGWLVPPNDPQKLAEVICHCDQNPEMMQTVVKQARAHVEENFPLAKTRQKISACIEEVLSQQGKR